MLAAYAALSGLSTVTLPDSTLLGWSLAYHTCTNYTYSVLVLNMLAPPTSIFYLRLAS